MVAVAVEDKAGKAYWDGVWEGGALPPPMNPAATNLSAFVDREFDRLFQSLLALAPRARDDADSRRLLEVGCGNSAWLPYLAKRFGLAVSGLDYSEIGVEKSKAILAREGVRGDVVLGDMFAPPPALLGAFDVVLSNGVVEHFTDTARVLRAISGFARPGGVVLTVIPNMTGAIGAAQRFLNREIFDVHVPLNRRGLLRGHEEAGLDVIFCDYHMFTQFGVCDIGRAPRGASGLVRRAAQRALVDFSRVVWRLETMSRPFKPREWLSGYVVALGVKRD